MVATAWSTLLSVVAAHPWIDAEQACVLASLSRRKTDRDLDCLVREGLVQTCHVAGLCTHGTLYGVTGLAARLAPERWAEAASPASLERTLLQIESLWGCRNLLVDLARREKLIRAASPDRLYLPMQQAGQAREEVAAHLDVMAWGLLARDDAALPFVIEWDLGEVATEAYRRRFDSIYRLARRCDSSAFPVFVMVTTNRVRTMQLLWLWNRTAQQSGNRLLRLYVAEWSAVVSGRPDVWRRSENEGTPVCLFHGEPGRPNLLLQPCRNAERAGRHVSFSAGRVLAEADGRHVLVRAHLSVPHRAARRLLRKIASWPLLSVSELTSLLSSSGRHETNVRTALQNLAGLGLVAEYTRPREPARYYLTSLGVRLLAAASGMEPGQYVRYRRWPVSHKLDQDGKPDSDALPHWRGAELDVGILVRHYEHTRDIRVFFASLAQVARCHREMRLAEGHALVVWDEGECRRYYQAEGRRHALVPDSGGMYRVGQELYEFFLEVDRGTMSRKKLARKFDCYYAYRRTGEYLLDGTHLPRLLVIVPDEGRAHLIRQVILERARLFGAQPLDAWIAVQETLNARGPASPVWRHVVDWKMRCCFAAFERAERLPEPLDLAQLGREVTRDLKRAGTIRARRALKGEG